MELTDVRIADRENPAMEQRSQFGGGRIVLAEDRSQRPEVRSQTEARGRKSEGQKTGPASKKQAKEYPVARISPACSRRETFVGGPSAPLSVYTENMKFEWDPAKAASNAIKHGISFLLAITVFDDPYALIAPDPEHSAEERREWIIGESDRGVLVVVFTERLEGRVYRIISARRANRRERKLYEEFRRLSL